MSANFVSLDCRWFFFKSCSCWAGAPGHCMLFDVLGHLHRQTKIGIICISTAQILCVWQHLRVHCRLTDVCSCSGVSPEWFPFWWLTTTVTVNACLGWTSRRAMLNVYWSFHLQQNGCVCKTTCAQCLIHHCWQQSVRPSTVSLELLEHIRRTVRFWGSWMFCTQSSSTTILLVMEIFCWWVTWWGK